MKKNKTLKKFVSDIDQFLQEFDKKHPQPSQSQQQEQKKYRRIYYLRDVGELAQTAKKTWEGF